MATEIRDSIPSTDAALQPALTPDVIPADRETAYTLWATVAHQNAADVARTLGIPEPTVRSWCQRDGWRSRLELEHQEQSQRVRAVMEAALVRIIPNVINRLDRIAMGHGDTKPVLTKDGEVIELEIPIPYQAQVNAAKELVAIFNGPKTHHHHHTADVPATPAPPAPSPSTPLASAGIPDPAGPLTREQAIAMTPAQRQAWEQARRSRF